MHIIKLTVYTYSTISWCVLFTEPYSISTIESHKFGKVQQKNAILSIGHTNYFQL